MPDATVKGGYWGDLSSDFNLSSGDNPTKRRIARLYNVEGLKILRELDLTLNGVAPGQTALETRARVANSTELGGLRTIETVSLVNRVTVAADVTEITSDILTYTLAPSTYPANLDGNPRGYPGG